jgi:penicillin amidase
MGLLGLEDATGVDEALAIARRSGVPALNFLVADSAGHIGWTIAGPLPKRIGFDGRLPVSWVFGDRRWDGFLPPEDAPTVRDPPGSVLWTANNRILGGRALALLGDGGYERPARAAQIRDDLAALPPGAKATPRDLLDIALDDRALFLARWRRLLLGTLTSPVAGTRSSRAEMRALVENGGGRADVDSVGYRLVQAFHEAIVRRVLDPIFAPCLAADPGFNYRRLNYDDAVWTLVRQKPPHMLDPRYAGWDTLLVAAADDAAAEAQQDGSPLASATWGRHNELHMVHPFSRILPAWLTGWLNMPAEPLPGDHDMPRVETPTHGASERFAVSPGHEEQGIFEMPGGQSGHPLSPFYRAGHEAWVRGEPAPFLPGPPEHTLTLVP